MLYKPSVGPKKTLTCTLATAAWVADGSTIPATESTRWGRTLQASDFPTWSFPPASVKYIEKLLISIYNTSGSNKTISYSMYKNGNQVNTGSATVTTSNYLFITANFYNVTVGDLLEIAVWTATNTNVTVSGSLKHIVPTRLLPTSKLCVEVSYTFGNYTYPSPINMTYQTTTEYIGDSITNTLSSATSRTFTGLSFISQNSYGLFRYGSGDIVFLDNVRTNVNTTQNGQLSYYPTTISYREIRRGI
jgi:hypothetical protein